VRHVALLLALSACAADPVLLPDAATPDAGPCGGACGVGTVCESGRCVSVDGGSSGQDVGALDVSSDRPVLVDAGVDAPQVDIGPTCASNTVGNCCGVACTATLPNTMGPACVAGRCGFASCAANYGDCDGNAANGCEVDLRASAMNCGTCGAPCAAGLVCTGGACVACPATAAGQQVCGEGDARVCTNVLTDRLNCRTCGRVCPAGFECSEFGCVIVCGTGLDSCGTGTAAYCSNFQTDRANCGGCRRACTASERCSGGRCL